jgi:hypothetical protein
MNESQKAWELRHAVDTKYERYARRIAEQLDHKVLKSSVDAAGLNNTYWDELKVRLREKPFDSCGVLDDFVKDHCFKLLNELPAEERRLLWLCTDVADKAEPGAFLGSTYPHELIGELLYWVKDLALEQAKEEASFASFGCGFFQRRDELLPLVGEILEALTLRGQVDSKTTALLQQLKTTVNSMPDQEPTEPLKLTLSLSARYEDSGGSRTYSVLVSPDLFELYLGGHEWTREAGGDAWSGPRLVVEADGTHQEDGEIEQMLREMLDAASDLNYEICVTRD